jgi:hypothetical protein
LEDITEFIRLEPGQQGVDLGPSKLAMMLEGTMADGVGLEHELRVRLLNGLGEPAFGIDHRSRVQFYPVGMNRLGTAAAVTFSPLAPLPIDDYTFEVYLDGNHLGTLDFPVLGAT